MELRKTDVVDALRSLRAYGDVWVTVEDLVKESKLSEKWVRESLNDYEMLGWVSAQTGNRGVRLYQLSPSFRVDKEEEDTANSREKGVQRSNRQREVVEIGGKPVRREVERPAPLPALSELSNRRAEIRRIMQSVDTAKLSEIFDDLNSRKENDVQSRILGNPFAAVRLYALDGLIDGVAGKVGIEGAIMIGTASSAKAEMMGFRFGSVSIPVKFGLTTAYGLIQQIVKDETEDQKEFFVPEKASPDGIDEHTYSHDDFPGMNKIVKETFHYGLDHQALDWALTHLRQRLHYRTDLEALERAKATYPQAPRLFLLKSGSLTPQEQHAMDFRDEVKASYLQNAFLQYVRLRDRVLREGGDSLVFGVLDRSEASRSIFREIIDELLTRELPGWEPGRMNAVDDNDVMGLLLNPGEYTPVIKKTPQEDILQAITPSRAKTILGVKAFNQYEAFRQQTKTYQFYMKFPTGRAIRFDYPVFLETRKEAIDIRDLTAPILFSKSSQTDDFEETQLPRVVSLANMQSRNWLAALSAQLPLYLGGRTK